MGGSFRPEEEDTNTRLALALKQRPAAGDPIPPLRPVLSARRRNTSGGPWGGKARGHRASGLCKLAPTACMGGADSSRRLLLN